MPAKIGEPSPKSHSQKTIEAPKPATVLVSVNWANASARQAAGLIKPALGLLNIITGGAGVNKSLTHPLSEIVLNVIVFTPAVG